MRLIDADALYKDICDSINEMTRIGIAVDGDYLWAKINDALENAPTIEERKKGKWIKKKSMIYCQNCYNGFEAIFIRDYNYCPNCGADCRGEQDE